MKILSAADITKVIGLITIAIGSPGVFAEMAPNGQYKIDPGHTTIQFSTTHLGISELSGRFNKFNGSLNLNRNGKSNMEVTVTSASIDTNHAARDKHLRSPDFFNVKQFPIIKFVSNKIIFNKAGEPTKLIGTMVIRGKMKAVTWSVTKVGAGKDPWGGYRAGYNVVTTIKRSHFGMKYMLGGVGDRIKLIINLELVKK